MTQENLNSPNDPREAAAYWFARVRSGNFTVAERERFAQWRQADPLNEHEYRALDDIWQAAALLSEAEVRALLETPAPTANRPSVARRRWLMATAASGTALIAGGLFLSGQFQDTPSHVMRHATAHGERRTVTLPDGSVIDMNVSTELVVRYYPSRRVVELLGGEAMFTVAANREQPFFVHADMASVRVTGTIFNVRREPDYVLIAVQAGSVEVTSGAWWNRDKAMLQAGMTARAQADSGLSVERADVGALTAWRQGKIVFKNQSLEDMVREMNRYLARPIHLTDNRLKRLRMEGVFSIQDADGFLQSLRHSLPVAVVPRADGGVDLSLLR